MTAGCLFVCSALLMFANGANGGGIYQRTVDGQTLVWNNYPRPNDRVMWSGGRDANGYATGCGTLKWYIVERSIVTGSNVPSARKRAVLVSRYSGNMVRGKLEGLVSNVDANGKTFHGTFVNGSKVDWAAGPAPASDQLRNERVSGNAIVGVPAEGPTPDQRSNERVYGGVVKAVPSQGSDSLQAVSPPSSLRPVVAAASFQPSIPQIPSSPSSIPAAVDPAVKNRVIADFKEQTQSVLSRVGDATGNFREIDRLDSMQKLPGPVSESVVSLIDRARDFRSKLGYETALRECRTETETVDALSAVDQVTRNIASGDASEASSKLADFLKNNPEPIADSQKTLWRYLTSMRLLFSRSQKEADIHLQRAQSLASTSKNGEAVREYREAYRAFPNPATAEKIRQLQDNSLGL
jgi:hypothetical protein